MALNETRIRITGDTTGLDATINKLQKVGDVDKKNADQFVSTQKKHQEGLKSTGDETTRLENKMRNLGERLVAVFAVERVFQFASACVTAFENAEKAANKLAFAVEKISGGGVSGFNQLKSQSDALAASLNYLYTPTQIQGIQTQLAQAKLTVQQIQDATPRILDMATQTGDSIDELTTTFVRASQGATGVGRELTKLGVSFSATGNKGKDFDEIMKKTADFSGAAANSLNDYSTASQQAAGYTEVLEEKLGSKLAPMWETIKQDALDVAAAFLGVRNEMYDLQDAAQELESKNEADKIFKQQVQDLANTVNSIDEAKQKLLDAQKQLADSQKTLTTNTTDAINAGVLTQQDMADNMGVITDQLNQTDFGAGNLQESALKAQDAVTKWTAVVQLFQDGQKKATEGFKKYTDAQLQAALDDLNDGVTGASASYDDLTNMKDDFYNKQVALDDKGLENLKKEIQKEIDARKKQADAAKAAYDKLIALQKSYEDKLKQMEIDAINDQNKSRIALMRDGWGKQTAEEDQKFLEEQQKYKKREDELNEIVKNGNSAQVAEAKLLLQQLLVEEDLARQVYAQKLGDIIRKTNDEILDEQLDFNKSTLQYQQDLDDAMLDMAKNEAKVKLDKGIYNQQQYDVAISKLELGNAKDAQKSLIAQDDADTARLQKKLDEDLKLYRDNQVLLEKDRDDLSKAQQKRDLDFITSQNTIADKQITLAEKQKEIFKDVVDQIGTFIADIGSQYNELLQLQIDNIAQQQQLQQGNIDVQAKLAAAGKKNTLDFEMKKQADLEKQRLRDERRLKRAKELEVFMNAVAEFSKTDPKTAVAKALAEVGIVKAVEATYAEKGGILGKITDRSNFSRRHPGGGDMLVHAQSGEGILSRKEMMNLGEANFLNLKAMLSVPISPRNIPVATVMGGGSDYQPAIKRLEDKLDAIIKKPVTTIDVDALGNLIETRTEGAVKTITKHILRKPRV